MRTIILSWITLLSFTWSGLNAVPDNMTLEEKAGQVLMPHFIGEIANDDARTLIQEAKVGGFIYFSWANGLYNPEQVKKLSDSLQALASRPLLIAIDQEGGRVEQLCKQGTGFTHVPSSLEVGTVKEPAFAKSVAEQVGKELKAVGININFAPVVDVNSNPMNPVIGNRSYGSDPKQVVRFARQAILGYHQAGVFVTLKHFPGHGDTVTDSHLALPTISRPMSSLEEVELVPFKELAPIADLVMTGHLLVPAMDKEHCVTLSKKWIDYLRNEIGFQGVIITDSLVMQGVLQQTKTIDEAAIQALIAGCDIVLLGGGPIGNYVGDMRQLGASVQDVLRVQQAIVAAVRSGRISETRLNEAVDRVLKLKERTEGT
jgi:beta-N-acetylhexosaminidase